MKKNMHNAMNRPDIDEGIRYLIRQLWKHNYKTTNSCQGGIGHSDEAYLSFISNSGDGWFEKISYEWGFERTEREDCCVEHEKKGNNFCFSCGAGLNGNEVYRRPRF